MTQKAAIEEAKGSDTNTNPGANETSYIPSKEFESLRQLELQHMSTRPDATGHKKEELVGLAVSGGGIRSAVFALGFLQALAVKDHLKKIDYLSTVSGGGYIGTAFSWLLHRLWKENDSDTYFRYGTNPEQFPFATSPRAIFRKRNESLINYMRRNREYLIPGDGIGVFSLLAAIFRGIILNALVYLPFFATAFFGLQILGAMIVPAGEVNEVIADLTNMAVANNVEFDAADWRQQIELGLLLLGSAIAVITVYLVVTISYAFRTMRSRRRNTATYGYRRSYDVYAGKLLLLALGLAIVGSVPFVAMYVDEPGLAGAGAVGAGLLAGILSFWKTQAKVLNRLPMPVLVWIGSMSLIYGVLLVSLMICKQLTGLSTGGPHAALLAIPGTAGVFALLAVSLMFSLWLGLLVDLNAVSLHRFYRDRLMETFMPDPNKVFGQSTVVGQGEMADSTPLSAICRYNKDNTMEIESNQGPIRVTKNALGPYHLINTNVVLTRSDRKTLRARGGDSFLLSPLYCGSAASGWRATKEFSGDRVTLPSAMATSGAAVNPDTGAGGDGMTRNPALSAFMRMLNLRLGYWVPNPNRKPGFLTNSYRPSLIVEGLMPRNRETANALELTDGGHFDNLAIYELIRREVPFIILLDAAADPKFEFSDFANLVEKIRADFGVVISGIKLQDLVPPLEVRDRPPHARAGVVSGEIVYSSTRKGRLFYVKTTLIDGLPEDIYGYWRTHNEFPDESTADQFFDEKQFEAYRELGYHLGAKLDELPEFSIVKDL